MEDLFFRFPKNWIFTYENYCWALMPLAAKTSLPVIATFSDKNGKAFPGEKTIAELAGITEKTLRRGIKGLNTPFFKYEYINRKQGGRIRIYKFDFPKLGNGEAFPFYQKIITSGQWASTNQAGKALYPVMRALALSFDSDKYSNDNSTDSTPYEYHEIYRTRIYDYFKSSMSKVSYLAGVSRMSVYRGIESLLKNGLIESDDEYSFRIMLK